MSGIVVDCSVAASWCFNDEVSSYADAALDVVRDEGGIIPVLWIYEITNVFRSAERRARITTEQTEQLLSFLAALPFQVVSAVGFDTQRQILARARAHDLTAYDAAYLHLAAQSHLALATLDRTLIAAARKAKIRVFEAR